jgi:ribulose-5-phosphate 4-epimerase/fuculose-1-phosphate aldolase
MVDVVAQEGVVGAVPVSGGREEWSPRVVPPVGVELSEPQKLAAAFRILDWEGFTENIAGHVTMRDEGRGCLWVNPWGLWWEEITASDLCRVDSHANVVGGRWDVTPAIHIHTELHRRRSDAAVVVHSHPYPVTVLTALGLAPEMLHQTAAMFEGDVAFIDEYTGEVASAELGAELADRIGDASVVLLANHGAIVTGASVEEATYRSATLVRQARLMCDVLATGRSYTVFPERFRRPMKASLLERGTEFYWRGALRRLLRVAPEVLD